MIIEKTIKIVREEMNRLEQRIKELESEIKRQNEWNKEHYPDYKYEPTCPAQTGAIRRASMDLTRALAKLRRYKAWNE